MVDSRRVNHLLPCTHLVRAFLRIVTSMKNLQGCGFRGNLHGDLSPESQIEQVANSRIGTSTGWN